MFTHKLKVTVVGVTGLFGVSATQADVSVPHVFSAGDEAVAAEINANFSTLADEINAIGQAGNGSLYSDYFIQPSSSGTLGSRNVIVWDQGNGCYTARGRFSNDDGITLEYGPEEPDTIRIWQQICTNGDDVAYQVEYVYAEPAQDSTAMSGIEINQDSQGDGIFDGQEASGYRSTSTVESTGVMEMRHITELFLDGDEVVAANDISRILAPLEDALQINGMTFNDVVVASYVGTDRQTFLARGIGAVLDLREYQDLVVSSGRRNEVIFYRIEGQGQEGSLSGTPFAGDAPINRWFVE